MGIAAFGYRPAIYQVGNLVTFCGYRYSPDYMYTDASDRSIGIVTSAIRATTIGEYFTYKVFWFKSMRYTEAIGAHLKLVSL
tara:strand:- start:75 stop:320 length:246 start_codon:yes stop_codon:yes gene_type:complete